MCGGEIAQRAGRDDVVEATRKTDNTLDLERDEPPEQLALWITTSPFTAGEAAYVQPSYDHGMPGNSVEACELATCTTMKTITVSLGLICFFLAQGAVYYALNKYEIAMSTVKRISAMTISAVLSGIGITAEIVIILEKI